MRFFKPVAVLLVISCLSCSQKEDGPGIEANLYETAIADAWNDYEKGGIDSALKKVDAILESKPVDRSALQLKSMILATKGKKVAAARLIEKLLEVEPDDEDLHHILGTLYFSLNEWEKAATHLDRNYSDPSRKEKALGFLIICYENLNRLDKASKTLEKMLEKNPDNALVLTKLGNMRAALGGYEQAAESFRKAIEADSYIKEAYLGLALVQASLERFDKAVETLRNGIKKFPGDGRLLITLAQTWLQLGRPLDAIEAINRIEGTRADSREVEFLRNAAEDMLDIQGKPVPPR